MDMIYDTGYLDKKYPDVGKYRVRNLRLAWRNIALYEAAVIAVILFSLGYIRELYDTAVRNSEGVDFLVKALVVLALFVWLPPCFFKSTKTLLEKTRQGTVVSHTFQKRVANIDRTSSHRNKFVWGTYISLVYQSEDGKDRKLTFPSRSDDVLKVGTDFVKYRGLPYPIPVYREKDRKNVYVCVSCGRHEKAEVLDCTYCGTSMVHFDF